MRRCCSSCAPHELVEIELQELLEQLIAAMECRKRMDVRVQLDPVELDAAKTRGDLYRIAQEALTNITRHSAATRVDRVISARRTKRRCGDLRWRSRPVGGTVELRIVDNGRGFDIGTVTPGHLGLSIMRERGRGRRRRAAFRAAPGHGTELTVRVDRTERNDPIPRARRR